MAVTGGTGAYFGLRGQAGLAGNIVSPRIASVVEDPAARRINGGGRRRYAYYVLPYSQPEVIGAASGPVIVHSSDFSPVTAANAATAGETLSLFATGLGPTRPGVDAGQPFPASPLSLANSPIEVLVNGVSAPVSFAGGAPGSVGNYQVNFQIPDGAAPGDATVGLTAAFIPGPTVQIPIR